MKAISALIGTASLTFSGLLGASGPQGQSAEPRPFAATTAEFAGPLSAAPRELADRRVSPPLVQTTPRSQTTPRHSQTTPRSLTATRSREHGSSRSRGHSRLRRGAVKGSFVWPTGLKAAVVRPFDPPAHKWLSGHRGVDLDAPEGGTVVSAGAGTVASQERLPTRTSCQSITAACEQLTNPCALPSPPATRSKRETP